MTTMHDVFEQDLGGPKHEHIEDCKAPALTQSILKIIQDAKAGDTCVVTALINALTEMYGTRFLERGVSPGNFAEFIAESFAWKISQVEAASMLLDCLSKRIH